MAVCAVVAANAFECRASTKGLQTNVKLVRSGIAGLLCVRKQAMCNCLG